MDVVTPWFWIAPLVAYGIAFAVVSVLLYLVLRFAIRDGLRAHSLWLERRTQRPRADDGEGS